MNIYHLPIVRLIRSTSRSFGIVRVFKTVFGRNAGYEDTFSAGLRAAIKQGDVVWDVGANVGYYTSQFLDWIGEDGSVVAFEPLPAARQKLNLVLASRSSRHNVIVCDSALADWDGDAQLEGDSPAGGVVTTAHLSDRESDAEKSKSGRVKVTTADLAKAELALPMPIVTKIDVEGYEEEVLKGGAKVFSSTEARHIFVEIHFERLDQRGHGEAPSRIVRLLKSWGYKVRWLDFSHLHAFRGICSQSPAK
jgi:FkbM family methyltransferase